MSERIRFVAHGGIVQGVGFRYFTQKRAREYGVTGWCRNTDDNKVEGEAQGSIEAMKQFLQAVDKGPRHAHVVKLDKEGRDLVEDESAFEIRH
ncbi:unnamed protein product [Clonostachys rhizophaga]|uniref:acylphosphatase n=1 Tax=Clonostachys rhizophaga TaxID=160324 RepID=A0A9N9V6J7_9HYPO|nr:unnamed protein product [Clonostachys rhizophaga]